MNFTNTKEKDSNKYYFASNSKQIGNDGPNSSQIGQIRGVGIPENLNKLLRSSNNNTSILEKANSTKKQQKSSDKPELKLKTLYGFYNNVIRPHQKNYDFQQIQTKYIEKNSINITREISPDKNYRKTMDAFNRGDKAIEFKPESN